MVQDCLYGDDELYPESCSLNNFNHRFNCSIDSRTVCIARVRVGDDFPDCINGTDEGLQMSTPSRKIISFQNMCDGYTDLDRIVVDGRYETDETECADFPCNNTYTRCDGTWNCLDGADEVNCEKPTICPLMHHLCLSPVTGNFTCLPIERVNDDVIDCLGATDEREFCRQSSDFFGYRSYRCWNSSICINSPSACSTRCPVIHDISMNFCQDIKLDWLLPCIKGELKNLAEKFICSLYYGIIQDKLYLSLNISSYYTISSSPILSKL